MRRAFLIAIFIALVTTGCPDRDGATGDVLIFAAASATDAVAEAARIFEERTAKRVVTNVAASSTLARQIEAGAPADLFISAHTRWVDALDAKGLLRPGSRADLVANRLVLIEPRAKSEARTRENTFSFEDATSGRFAIADPEHVPAGAYAREALINLGYWTKVSERLLTTRNVRAALRLVEAGEADAGIVYATDAARSDKVRQIGLVPEKNHTPIRYAAVLTREARPAAAEFLAFLRSADGERIFVRHGFGLPLRRDGP